MKIITLSLLLFIAQLFIAVPSAFGQTSPIPSNTAGNVVLVSIVRFNNGTYSANFDTAGQTIGELNAAALSDKFFRTSSVAAITNFVVQNGYRILSFSPVQGHISPSIGGGELNGYAVLFERTSSLDATDSIPPHK